MSITQPSSVPFRSCLQVFSYGNQHTRKRTQFSQHDMDCSICLGLRAGKYLGVPQTKYTPLEHAEGLTCPVSHLCLGSSCCDKYLRAFVMVLNQHFIAIYTHSHFPTPKHFTCHNSIWQKSNLSQRKHSKCFYICCCQQLQC